MKKPEIIEKLTALGIDFDPNAKKSELEALLPIETPEAPVDAPVAEPSLEVAPEPVSSATTFSIFQGSNLIRIYTTEIHGQKAKELAMQFASKFKGATVRES